MTVGWPRRERFVTVAKDGALSGTQHNANSIGGTPQLAIVGTGNFATNLAALLESRGLQPDLFVDRFRTGTFLGRPVVKAAELTEAMRQSVQKFVLAISTPEHREAARLRLRDAGVAEERILPLRDDPDLQILRLLFARFGQGMRQALLEPGVTTVGALEERFLAFENSLALAQLDPQRPTVALGYFGRGGGFRRHIGGLVPRLQPRFNVVTMADELGDQAEEAPCHLTISAESARALEAIDLVLSAHVFPCAPATVPRVTFSHVIYDFNLTSEYHAARLALCDTHYLFASSRPSFDAYVDLVRRFDLKNRLCVIPGGYMQLDRNLTAIAEEPGAADAILYAPTLSLADYDHADLVNSVRQGPELLQALLESFGEHDIIFRPHPSDLRLYELGRSDPRREPFGRMLEMCRTHDRLHLDDGGDYMASYRRAALLISDTSSTAFTFAFSTGRPVVFFSPREEEMSAALAHRLRFVADRSEIGHIARDPSELCAAVERLLRDEDDGGERSRRLWQFRDRMIFHPGGAAEYFVRNIDHVLSGEKHPDWCYLNW